MGLLLERKHDDHNGIRRYRASLVYWGSLGHLHRNRLLPRPNLQYHSGYSVFANVSKEGIISQYVREFFWLIKNRDWLETKGDKLSGGKKGEPWLVQCLRRDKSDKGLATIAKKLGNVATGQTNIISSLFQIITSKDYISSCLKLIEEDLSAWAND